MSHKIEAARKSIEQSGISTQSNVYASTLTTFKIGGVVDLVAVPKSTDELIACADLANRHGVKYIVVGRGSNILFPDNGYRGLVIRTDGLRSIEFECAADGSFLVRADCGVPLTSLALECAKKSLTGLEFAYGIPGALGGAIYMNAGAYGGEMSNIVAETLCYDAKEQRIVLLRGCEHKFEYRKSVFSVESQLICLTSTLRLTAGEPEEIFSIMNANKTARKEKQPLEYPSAGSIFKRHPGYFIGKIIDEMGLKGFAIGGAQVSEKHAGFIVNTGNATANDVKALIGFLSNKIHEHYGFYPECEILMVE